MTDFADYAAAAMSEVSGVFGESLLVASGGWSGAIVVAIVNSATEHDELGRPVIRDARTIEVRAEDIEKLPAGTEIELLDSDGEPIERRVVQGEPEAADRARRSFLIDTRPVVTP